MSPPDPCWRVFSSLQALRLPRGADALPVAEPLSALTVGCGLHACRWARRPLLWARLCHVRVGCMYSHVRTRLCVQSRGAGPACLPALLPRSATVFYNASVLPRRCVAQRLRM